MFVMYKFLLLLAGIVYLGLELAAFINSNSPAWMIVHGFAMAIAIVAITLLMVMVLGGTL